MLVWQLSDRVPRVEQRSPPRVAIWRQRSPQEDISHGPIHPDQNDGPGARQHPVRPCDHHHARTPIGTDRPTADPQAHSLERGRHELHRRPRDAGSTVRRRSRHDRRTRRAHRHHGRRAAGDPRVGHQDSLVERLRAEPRAGRASSERARQCVQRCHPRSPHGYREDRPDRSGHRRSVHRAATPTRAVPVVHPRTPEGCRR